MSIASLASLLVAELNAQDSGLSTNPAAVRAFLPTQKLEELAERQVVVVPRQRETTRLSRDGFNRRLTVDIAIRRANQAIDDLLMEDDLAYAEELEDYLIRRKFLDGFRWVQSEQTNPYIAELLRQHGLFTAVLSVTYEIDVAG